MPRFCTNCGSQLEESTKLCINCGTPIQKVSEKSELKKEEIKPTKKKVKYTLGATQRKIFLRRILPTILAGALIWLISEIIFSLIFIEIEFNPIFLGFYIVMIVTEALLFTSIYFVSKQDKTNIALFIFFLFSFIAGILSLPIMIFTEFLPQVHMLVSLSVGALLITFLIGLILRENYFAKGYIWAHIVIFLIGITIVEIVFILVFDIHNFLLTIPVSLAYMLIVSLTTMFYGSKAIQKNEDEPWMLIFFKIEGILLLSLIIAIAIVVVVLILVALGVACGGSNFDLSGIGGGTSRTKRKKKVK